MIPKKLFHFFIVCLLLTTTSCISSPFGWWRTKNVETSKPEPAETVSEASPEILPPEDESSRISDGELPEDESLDESSRISDGAFIEETLQEIPFPGDESSKTSDNNILDEITQETLSIRDEFSKVISKGDIPDEMTQETLSPENKNYKIGSGDILEIVTWKEPDFTKEEVPVRLDGKISFPLIEDVRAGGRTTADVRDDIQNELKRFIKNPVVSVAIKSAESQKFYILGEVAKTGEYNLVKNLTILQAFALAQGFTEWAAKKEIILIRHENSKDKIIRVNYKDIVKGEGLEQNIRIKADDTIIVP